MAIEKVDALALYRKMLLARHFDLRLKEFFEAGSMHGTAHFSEGEEAVGVGVCHALTDQDFMMTTHRGHSQSIGKGMDVKAMMAEMFGKATGCCRGKGGSMHMADFSRGCLGANGIVAANIPLATGVALACRMRHLDRVVVCFFGDGATNQGSFHESLNLASLWKLPIVYVCVNNQYAFSLSVKDHLPIENLSRRGDSYGLKSVRVDGNDVEKVYLSAREAISEAREGIPQFLVYETHRISGHSKSDCNAYRENGEIDRWRAQCPIERLRRQLFSRDWATQEEVLLLEKLVVDEIATAVSFAKQSPNPPLPWALEDVYV